MSDATPPIPPGGGSPPAPEDRAPSCARPEAGRRARRGDPFVARVEDLAPRGWLLARDAEHDLDLRLRHAPLGSTVRGSVLRRAKGVLEGRVEEVLDPGPHAVPPRCPHFGTCGGCAYQDTRYAAQLEALGRAVHATLAGAGVLGSVPVRPVLGMEDPWHYRNKMDFSFASRRWVEPDEPEGVDASFGLGLHVPGRWDKVLDLRACSIAFEGAEAVLHDARRIAREQGLEPWDVHRHTGLLRHLVLRKGFHTGELLVDLVTRELDPERVEPYARALLAAQPGITTLVQGVSARAAKVAVHDDERVLHGAGTIRERLGGVTFELSAESFFQTNTLQAERLVEVLREEAGLGGGEVVYDLYCGVGTLGLCLARDARLLYGVEQVQPAVLDARRNAAANGVHNALHEVGDVRAALAARDAARVPAPDVVLVDPPRVGLHPDVVASVAALGARRVLYVSCNVASAARDLPGLLERGYVLTAVRPVDLFPHTPHVECVLTLERRP